jgi:hypothetical protein
MATIVFADTKFLKRVDQSKDYVSAIAFAGAEKAIIQMPSTKRKRPSHIYHDERTCLRAGVLLTMEENLASLLPTCTHKRL